MRKVKTGAIALLLGSAFNAHALPIPDDLDQALTELIAQHGLTGKPDNGFDLPSVDDPEVKLGKLLFFSKALSGDKQVACASCHHPYLGGGDGLSLPVGTLAQDPDVLGPGRKTTTGQFYVPRNSPSIFNAWVHKRSLFRDARVEFLDWLNPEQGISTPDVPHGEADPNAGDSLLAAQARFPVVTPSEMQGFEFMKGASNEAVRAHLAARIGNYGSARGELFRNQWRDYFAAVYGDKSAEEIVTFDNITRALAAYQQSMNFTDNPWNRYVQGDKNALSESEKRGAYLYLYMPPPPSDGGSEPDFLPTQCIGCHNTDSFSQTKGTNHHRLAFPQIGPGTGEMGDESNDRGRMLRNQSLDDIHSFRSTTLLNVEVTAPYGHAGSYDTLEEVIEHYDDYHAVLDDYINNQGWCRQPQFKDIENCVDLFPDTRQHTDAAAKIIDDEIADGAPVLRKLELSTQEKTDLVNFMKALTDPCVKQAECLKAWLPQPQEGDPDGLQLFAKNYQGVPLYLPADCRQGDTAVTGSRLLLAQGECISGKAHYFYVDVAQDNTTLYFSSRGGAGRPRLFYNPDQWPDPANARAISRGTGTEQVLKVTVNRGRHFVSALAPQGYEGLTIAAGIDSALREPGEQPRDIVNACEQGLPSGYAELMPGRAQCASPGDSYFFVKVTEPGSTLEVRTRHGAGNSDLFVSNFWPGTSMYTFASRSADNTEFLRIDGAAPGWYYFLLSGDGQNEGVSIQVDLIRSDHPKDHKQNRKPN
ncbi:cytochrome c peroxidase [Pseudoalteromonas sp. OOF1S-7]|uniref:cytochrome c peroxidase n=1 Tax=Pseudoalteromonas sp. OOF1S-7 TaxID=2917757 RepID=UPI001EF43CC7|nr:cytochrome c peroxidase [Pseudoalteromonas sp. OOF1S-7]MCG7537320.1 cytochrome C peroxidase [Pseudoalteromonas sp. OOF1S-7]